MEKIILKCCLCFSESKLILLADNLKNLTESLLSIEIQTPIDSRPQLICSSCYNSVHSFGKFRKRIRKLRRQLQSEKEQEDNEKTSITKSHDTYRTKKEKAHKDINICEQPCEEIYNALQVKKKHTSKRSHEETHDIPYVMKNEKKFRNRDHHKLRSDDTSPSKEKFNASQTVEEGTENAPEEPSNSVFLCDLCPYHSCRPKKFSRHVRSHGHLTFRHRICSLCSHICDGVSDLIAHRKEMHPNNAITFGCSACDENFPTKRDVTNHEKSVHNIILKKNFHCKICSMIFDTKVSLSNHQCQLRSVENPKTYEEQSETVVCKKSCADEDASELQSVEIIDDYELQTIKSEDTEIDHQVGNISVKENTDLMCKECNENFTTVAALQNHVLSSHGDYSKAKKCSCGAFFLNSKSLDLHKLTVHSTSVTHTSETDRSKVVNSFDNGSNNTSDSIDIKEHDNSDLVTKSIEFKNIKKEVSKVGEKLISYDKIKMEKLSDNNNTSESIKPTDFTENSQNGTTQELKKHNKDNNNGSMKTGLGKFNVRDADISFRDHPGKNNFRSQDGGGPYYFNSYNSNEQGQGYFNSPYRSKWNGNYKKKHKNSLHEYRDMPHQSKNYCKKYGRHH